MVLTYTTHKQKRKKERRRGKKTKQKRKVVALFHNICPFVFTAPNTFERHF